MRRFFTALVLVLAIYLVFSRFAEAQQVLQTLAQGHFLWLGLAALTQLAWLGVVAATYRFVYRLLGMDMPLAELLPLVATSSFVNVVAPSAGMGGLAVFVSDARRRGLSSARATVAMALVLLFDYLGFLCVLAVGLVVLLRRNRLDPGSLSAAAILLLVAVGLAGLLILGARSAQALARVLVRLARLINRLVDPFLHRDYLSEARAISFASEMAEGLSALRAHWQAYLVPGALALLGKALLIGILFSTFMAFNQPFTAGTLIAGFSICYLFLIVSPTPAGLGFVEGILPLTLVALGVPKASAVLITIAYRGLTFWLPFGYGFIAFRFWYRRGNAAPS
jgi:glycosyltransferase 2 family protein